MTAKFKKYVTDQHDIVLDMPLEDGTTHTVTIGPDILISDCRRNEEKEQIEIWIADHSSKNGDSPDIVIPFDDIIMDDIKLYNYSGNEEVL